MLARVLLSPGLPTPPPLSSAIRVNAPDPVNPIATLPPHQNTATPALLSTAELQNTWSKMALEYNRDAVENPEYWAGLINWNRAQEAKKMQIHPAEVFGEKASRAYYEADRYLKDIPIGEFKLDFETIMAVNRLIVKKIKPFRQAMAKLIPFANGILLRDGGILRRRRVYYAYNGFPMREERYQQLMANQADLGVSFSEYPWSKLRRKGQPGDRYGILTYPDKKLVADKLNNLIAWYNAEHDKIINHADDAMDPVDLAARFQILYVAIHPNLDGNGRTSRALMTRILREFGLPPVAGQSYASDIDLSYTEHANNIRAGISNFIQQARNNKPDPIPFIGNRAFGTKVGILHPLMTTDLDAKSWEQIFNFSTRHTQFVLSDDGFFYNDKGIPHVLQGKTLYPITDTTYRLYGYGGTYNGVEGTKRDLNPEHQKIVDLHVATVKQIADLRLDPREIQVADYAAIAKANDLGDHHFYDWQIPLLEHAVNITENPITQPFAVLCQNRGDPINPRRSGTTNFENVWLQGWKKMNVSDVVGQYEVQDFYLHNLGDYIHQHLKGEKREQLLFTLEQSRIKLHTAGRQLLESYFSQKMTLAEEDYLALKNHPEFAGFELYLKYSKLGYATYFEGLKKRGDKKIYLLRAASKTLTRHLGFQSEHDMNKLFERLVPAHKKVRRALIRANAELRKQKLSTDEENASPAKKSRKNESGLTQVFINIFGRTKKSRYILRQLSERILSNPYTYRGMAKEFDRVFVDLLLHASNRPPKMGLSFTVSPHLLFNVAVNQDGEAYTRFVDPMIAGAVFLVGLPKRDVKIQFGSKWRDQYEIWLRRGRGALRSRLATRHVFNADQLVVPTDPLTASALAFLDSAFYLDPTTLTPPAV